MIGTETVSGSVTGAVTEGAGNIIGVCVNYDEFFGTETATASLPCDGKGNGCGICVSCEGFTGTEIVLGK